MITIKHLSDHKEHIDQIIQWLWQEWGEENNYEFWKILVENSLGRNDLPQTFIALQGAELVGTVGLWRCDLMNRQDLFPWLAALYIKDEFRRKGVGATLQHFLCSYAKEMGYGEVFLFADIENYYEKTGWQYIGDGTDWSSKAVKLYKYNLYT